jgi:CYTH domain-containing protein
MLLDDHPTVKRLEGASHRSGASKHDVTLPRHVVDLDADELRNAAGQHVDIRPRSFAVLRLLAENAGAPKRCIEPIIAKTRHEVLHEGMLWFVDVFESANSGLVLAEVELEYEAQNIVMPPWAGEEVTTDRRFSNSHLRAIPS